MLKISTVYFFKVLLCIVVLCLFNLKQSLSDVTINTSAKYAVLMDYETGRVLLNKNSNISMAPASMSKLMTIYMAFEAIKQDRISLDTILVVSENYFVSY